MTQTIHVSQKYTSVDFIMAMKQNAVYISENMLIYLMDQHKNGMNDKIVFFSLLLLFLWTNLERIINEWFKVNIAIKFECYEIETSQ